MPLSVSVLGYIQTRPQTLPVAGTPSFSSMNVVPTAPVKVKCTEFEPECVLFDTTVTVFAATLLSTVHAAANVVPLSKPSQNTAATGQLEPPSPEDATPDPLPLSARPPSLLPPASSIDLVVPLLEPLDPMVRTPLLAPPDELLLAPPDELLLALPDELLLALPPPLLPPLEDGPTCAIIVPPDAPPCSTEPASAPGDEVGPLQAPRPRTAKANATLGPGPPGHAERIVIHPLQ